MVVSAHLPLTVLNVSHTHTGTSLTTATTSVDVKLTGMVSTVLTTSASVILNVIQNMAALAQTLVIASAVMRTHGCAQMVMKYLWDLNVTVCPTGQAKTATSTSDLVTASVSIKVRRHVTDQDQRTVTTVFQTLSVTQTENVSAKKTTTYPRTVMSTVEHVIHAVHPATDHLAPTVLNHNLTPKSLTENVTARADGLEMTVLCTTVSAHVVAMDVSDQVPLIVYNCTNTPREATQQEKKD